MIAFALSNWRMLLMGLLLGALAIQEVRVRWIKAEFVTYRAEIERRVAENKVKAAQEQARIASNATKALDDLQARLDTVNRSYRLLRERRGSPAVPALASAAPSLSSCPGKPDESDAAAKFLGEVESRVASVLEQGDKEIAKYVELWKLQEKNSGR
jgi:hypothetical protein